MGRNFRGFQPEKNRKYFTMQRVQHNSNKIRCKAPVIVREKKWPLSYDKWPLPCVVGEHDYSDPGLKSNGVSISSSWWVGERECRNCGFKEEIQNSAMSIGSFVYTNKGGVMTATPVSSGGVQTI